MRKVVFIQILALGLMTAFEGLAQQPQRPDWAFNVPSKTQPPAEESKGPIHVPGSSQSFTAAQIDDLANPPVWFPDEHPNVPEVIVHGKGAALACGSCHLLSGHGHPESADLTGLPAEYIIQQMEDFKTGARKDPARMNAIAMAMPDEDIRKAADWFASLKTGPWIKVVETDTVPQSYVSARGRMRLPLPGGGMEPLGNRIVELPEDAARAESRDPHSPFIAYVPKGSIAKGEALVKTGGGKTIACGICHGDHLEGIGDVPRLAGQHPYYIARQLFYFQGPEYSGPSAALMKKVVPKLTADDMLAIAAYAASLGPK